VYVTDKNPGYIRYDIGDIVRERDWIFFSEQPMYGIIVHVERDTYLETEWLASTDDRIHVYWFKWRATEMLPAMFVELVSKTETVKKEK